MLLFTVLYSGIGSVQNTQIQYKEAGIENMSPLQVWDTSLCVCTSIPAKVAFPFLLQGLYDIVIVCFLYVTVRKDDDSDQNICIVTSRTHLIWNACIFIIKKNNCEIL